MIKVKDGYAKLIGTTYQGSATQVLLSNGGDLEYSASSKASTLVQRNASQHIYATYFNSAISDEALTDIGSVYVRNTSDTFIRRVSKTQFYSILDDKFVTLDTTQSITGAKTFSTSVRFANNASIIQNQNDTSNYTTILKWYKNGASRNTYDPSIGQHNTGGDGNGSICILPYPTETSPWGGTVGLFISKGVLKLDGKSVALAENYYTKTKSDERYVNVTGDTMTGPLIVKATVTGTQLISTIATGTSPLKVTSTTVVTNLNSDLFDGFHETAFVRSFWTSSPGYDCSKYNSRPLISFTYSNNAPFTGGFIDVVTNGYGFYLGTSYTSNAPLYYKRHGISSDGGMGTWQQLARITDNVASATKLQTARTINGTLFDGTANITTAYWGTARTITLSGAVTGSASVNGSQNVTITTTYQTGSIDGRYVGGNKTANHGSSGTAYTADSYSSTFARKEFVAFAERGSWAYANNGYVTTDTGMNIPLAGTAVFQWGASDTNKTQLFITPYNNSRVSNPAANEMLFYTSNGSGYTSAWTRVLTHRNYTAYFNPANYVTALGTNGNYVTWTKNRTTNNLTVPYATKANRLTLVNCYNGTTNNDLWSSIKTANNTYIGTATIYEVYNDGGPTTYGEVLDIVSIHSNHWQPQLWFDSGKTGSIRHRNKDYNNATWGSWYTLLDTNNYPGLLDGRYVTLTTAQTVSGVKTFSTQQKFTVATGTSPFTVTSTTVVTNLNSDLLDGRHLGNATGRIPYIVSFPAYSSFGSSTSTLDYEKNILKWIWTNQNHGGDTLLIGVGRPNSKGNLQIQLYGTSGVNSSTGYPKYSSAIYYPLGGRPICFGTTDYNFYSYSLAFSDDIKDPANYYWANIKVSASSSTATQPTFNTCYTSNWFRSSGATGWFNQSYSGGVYMNENYWVKTYGGTMMYIAPDAHAWGIGGHNIAMKLYHSSHIGINFATSAYTWGIYANSNGNMYIGRRTGNVDDDSGTCYHTLTASYISSPGFYHSAIGSNSYVLLAGGSYKGLGDFAKGNAGSATKGVYVTGGTVTAMTYSLSSNLNSGTSGKLAYYSAATTVAAYTSTVGSTHQPVYMSSGVPTICGYSFKGSSRQPIVLLSGVFYRSGTTWYMDSARTHKVVDATPSITISGARMQITLPGTTISSGVVTQEQTTDFSARSTADVNSHGNGAYGFAVYSNAANYVYVRTWCQRNDKNHSWASDGKSWTTFLMRIQVTLFGYIN